MDASGLAPTEAFRDRGRGRARGWIPLGPRLRKPFEIGGGDVGADGGEEAFDLHGHALLAFVAGHAAAHAGKGAAHDTDALAFAELLYLVEGETYVLAFGLADDAETVHLVLRHHDGGLAEHAALPEVAVVEADEGEVDVVEDEGFDLGERAVDEEEIGQERLVELVDFSLHAPHHTLGGAEGRAALRNYIVVGLALPAIGGPEHMPASLMVGGGCCLGLVHRYKAGGHPFSDSGRSGARRFFGEGSGGKSAARNRLVAQECVDGLLIQHNHDTGEIGHAKQRAQAAGCVPGLEFEARQRAARMGRKRCAGMACNFPPREGDYKMLLRSSPSADVRHSTGAGTTG